MSGPINVFGAGLAIENSFVKILFHQRQDKHRCGFDCQTCYLRGMKHKRNIKLFETVTPVVSKQNICMPLEPVRD